MHRLTLPIVLVFALGAARAGAAHAGGAHARLQELNQSIQQGLDATPTKVDDLAAEDQAIARMTQIADAVQQGLTSDLRRDPEAFGTVQDNLRKLQERLAAVKALQRCTVALQKLEAAAAAHREPDKAEVAAATTAIARMRDHRGAYPEGYEAVVRWHQEITQGLAAVPWPAELQPIELDRSALAKAMIPVHGAVEDHRWKPIAILHVGAGVRTLQTYGARGLDVHVRFRGPVREDHGVVAGPDDAHNRDDFDEGTYLLEAQGPGRSIAFDLVLGTPDTPRERTMQLGKLAADAPLEQHQLATIYPFLGRLGPAYLRQRLFSTAPRELFVYAKDDLDKTDTDSSTGSEAGQVFPRKDEPLLVVGAGEYGRGLEVIDAEGLSWWLRDWKMLAVAPAGRPALPEKIHEVKLTYQADELRAHGEGGFSSFESSDTDPVVKQYVAVVDRWNACVNKVLARYGGAIANDYDVITYEGGQVKKVEALSEKAWQEADRTCNTKSFDAKVKGFDAKLSAAHNKARAQALDAIRAQWAP